MKIGNGQVVTIEYTLKDSDGSVLETSKDKGAITFVLGSERMLPGLAKAMEGMAVGETRTGTIPPGQLVPISATGTRRVGFNEFPQGTRPGLGDRFQARGVDGQALQFEVTEVQDDAVVVHLLHPLHDHEIFYEVSVLAARRVSVPPPPPGVEDADDVVDLTDDLLEE
ncbi:MAG: FKBP-type peptidyl-prolyl cis-trans isomerase [Myxococcales bacterium]|nr:FKBP-type peptidyl-prolyl cis-trans isomerase [Myxococcales bacterium]MCB9525678.1 FKBP-type peptidyl-prolyl cis-trans isomerase [Myxococcales bacterium]